MGITKLGHVGIHVADLERMADFYSTTLGLTITDRDQELGMIFLSARPDEEHHELLLCGGRTAPPGTLLVQQISFRCNALDDIVEYSRRFHEQGVPIDMEVTHGNAVAVYFYDHEGNRCEVYWNTGLAARQPFLERVDLTQPAESLHAQIAALVTEFGTTGHVDMSVLAAQDL
jgi:catechol-2,3-dioxygenase